MPRVSPRLLNTPFAQAAENCDFRNGQLRPSKAPLDTGVDLQLSTKSFYWYNREGNGGAGFWFEWDADVDVVRSPIADDTDKRVYFTGDGVPGFTDITLGQSGTGPYPGARYDLGLPAPGAPTATGPTGSAPDGTQEEETAYIMTFVDTFGAEGPPSPPSQAVTRWDGSTVSLTLLEIATGNFNVTAKRIYRLTLSGVYQFVAEIPNANDTYDDSVVNASLGEPVPSDGWVAPHPDMIGLTAIPGGVLMGWWDDTIAFCEPYQPHAWPVEYRQTVNADVVGAAVASQGIVVVTRGKPYMILGTNPASYQPVELDHVYPGISKRSVVDMGDYVAYASPEGIVAVGGSQPQLLTEEHINPEQWVDTYGKSSLKAVRHKNRYLGFYDGTPNAAFAFSPEEGFRDFAESASALWRDPQTGDVYLRQGTDLLKWDEGADAAYEWVSKEFTLPPQQRYGVCKVDADAYPVAFECYLDGVLAKSLSVASRSSFRLPTTAQYRTLRVRVTGSAPINFIQLASSKDEIR